MNYRIVKIYTEALYEAAAEQKKTELVFSDMKSIREVFANSAEFRQFCANPSIGLPARISILQKIFTGKVDKLTENFLQILAKKNRLNFIQEICQQFEELYKEKHNIALIKIMSSTELATTQISSIAHHLKLKLRKEIESVFRLDPLLMGGFKVAMGDVIYDSTIKSQLEKLRKNLYLN